jgi:hypothetical protein
VLEINEKAGSVKVNNAGQIATLTFDKNGAKAVASAAVPGATSPIPQPHILGGAQPGATPGNPNALRTIPTRSQRSQDSTASNSEVVDRSPTAQLAQAMAAQSQNVTPEEQTIMIEAQRMQLQQQGKEEEARIFPNTELLLLLKTHRHRSDQNFHETSTVGFSRYNSTHP